MDEVLEQLENTVIGPKTDAQSSDFEGLYKNWGKLNNQEERRKETLEIQKSNRNSSLDVCRGILNLVKSVESTEIFRHERKAFYRPSIYVAGFNKVSPSYKHVLMLSEWMVEKPEDFNENWYVVPCPKGVRVLVVASQGTTRCYTKMGQYRTEFRSMLPGANRSIPKFRSQCCVLDCFYHENLKTMFILDLLAWNSQPMTDGETEFRHYWLQTQLEEIPEVKVINKKNNIIFKLLPKVSCEKESLNKFMSTWPMFDEDYPKLDGLLFYHKRAHYVGGETPLVGWLYPFMVQEVLGSDITVNDKYLSAKPSTYVNQAEYIEKFEATRAKKMSRFKRNSNAMDTATCDTNKTETETESQEQPEINNVDTMEAEDSKEKNENDKGPENMEPEPTETEAGPTKKGPDNNMEPEATEIEAEPTK